MNLQQEQQIIRMRSIGGSYNAISKELGLSVNTVKSFCQRHNIGGAKPVAGADGLFCPCCGGRINKSDHCKQKRFCSDKCREKWWNEHKLLIKRRKVSETICAGCGKPFTDYSSAKRKYCSHACYINARFKGGDECG